MTCKLVAMSAECDFIKQTDGSYCCQVTSMEITSPDEIVTSFKANPMELNKLIISNQTVNYIPKGIPELLPNLKVLSITNCKLKEIKAEDLRGFDKLVYLNLSNNCLKYLPDDLFRFVPQLEKADFSNNKINLKLLEPLINKQSIDLRNNKVNVVL